MKVARRLFAQADRFNVSSLASLDSSIVGSPKVALLFPGQGSQFVGMAADIYKFKSAKRVLDECEAVLGEKLTTVMFEGPRALLTSTANAQPAILAHSIAILRVLESEFGFDITKCTYALGHSLGEYSALVATRSLTLADAIRLVRLRGTAMQNAISDKSTAMKALLVNGEHLADIEDMMNGTIQKNMPQGEVAEIVISGTSNGVEFAASVLHSNGYAGRSIPLPVSAPFHCRLMAPVAVIMEPALRSTIIREPIVDVISNVTGKPFSSASEIESLLIRQITETVQWHRSIKYARDDFVFDWIACGPSQVLANLLKKNYPHDNIRVISNAKDLSSAAHHIETAVQETDAMVANLAQMLETKLEAQLYPASLNPMKFGDRVGSTRALILQLAEKLAIINEEKSKVATAAAARLVLNQMLLEKLLSLTEFDGDFQLVVDFNSQYAQLIEMKNAINEASTGDLIGSEGVIV